MESRDKLFKQYKSDCPQTIEETDTAFDNDNFIDWLCQQNKAQLDEIDKLKSKVSNWMDKYIEVNEENKKLKSELKDKDIDLQHYVDKCFKLESRISELENKVLESIAPALKYFNGFDTEDQNEAAFHGLNNLNNYITNNPKTN